MSYHIRNSIANTIMSYHILYLLRCVIIWIKLLAISFGAMVAITSATVLSIGTLFVCLPVLVVWVFENLRKLSWLFLWLQSRDCGKMRPLFGLKLLSINIILLVLYGRRLLVLITVLLESISYLLVINCLLILDGLWVTAILSLSGMITDVLELFFAII